jgi:hypothetical protein
MITSASGQSTSTNSVFGIMLYNQNIRAGAGGNESKTSNASIGVLTLNDSPTPVRQNHQVANNISSNNIIFPKIDKI